MKAEYLVVFLMIFLGSLYCQGTGPVLSITIDDPIPDTLNSVGTQGDDILKTFEKFGIRSALFVCGKRVNSPQGKELINNWDKAGHLICNHSYSHSYFHSDKITVQDYKNDMLRCDSMISNFVNYTKLFRYPFLKEGNTIEKRDNFRKFLGESGYKNGSVTIDASDWYIDQKIKDTLKLNPDADLAPYRDYYLQHIYERAVFYEELSFKLTGRHIKHTLLLHYNKLNMLFLSELLQMFIDNGWKLVDAKTAFEDPVFSAMPEVLPAGESLIWSIAKQTEKFDDVLRYPGEDSEYEEEKLAQYLNSYNSINK